MQRIIIIGAGGFGRETAFLVEEINRQRPCWNLLGFLDEDVTTHGRSFNGYSVIGGLDWCLNHSNIAVACAIGDPRFRKKVVGILKQSDIQFPNLVHPNVVNYPGNSFKAGNIVHPGNIININVTVGNYVCFEMGSTIGHDVVIEDFVSIMPGANVAGNVVLEEGCFLGTGCSIIQGKRIGKWSIVGAGAVVIDDVPPYSTVVGVPARVVNKNENFKMQDVKCKF